MQYEYFISASITMESRNAVVQKCYTITNMHTNNWFAFLN